MGVTHTDDLLKGSAIILVGLPGAGKSTIGKRLAQRLGVSFLDSDEVIEQRIGCSIRAYFEREGEESFRAIEQQVLVDLLAVHDGVLATGGGIVLRESNRRALRDGGRVLYLHATPEALFNRLRHDTKRPLLQVEDPLARLHALYGERDPLYREIAHQVIDTGTLRLPVIVSAITKQLKTSGFHGRS